MTPHSFTNHLINNLNLFYKMTLTNGQRESLEEIKIWLSNRSGDDFFTLMGRAGTGKTTLLDYIVQYAKESLRFNIVCTAPTNKAVKVLSDKISHNKFRTIHSLLKIRPKRIKDKEVFVPDNSDDMKEEFFDLIIVDECSMVSEELLKLIRKKIRNKSTKVLFSGDIGQLQPINEEISETFLFPSTELTEIVRHGDVISKSAEKVRCSGEIVEFNQIIHSPIIEWKRLNDVKEAFKNFPDNPDNIRVLCWTNENVRKWNKTLRKVILGYEPKEEFVVGEAIMAREACLNPMEQIILNNSEEGIILSVNEQKECWDLRVRKMYGMDEVDLKVIKEDFIEEFNEILSDLANRKEWSEFWLYKKKYHDITHCMAMTVHKSQGSTFNTVVADTPDITKNYDLEERNQLVYVALTRASNNIYLF